MEQVSEALAWLWDTVAEPVLTRLTELGLVGDPPAGGEEGAWPRVWWMPTGLLSFLPVHAAGRHGERRSVLDRVVSSYTPTLHALRHARERPHAAPGRAVVVAVPDPPGLPALTATEREAAAAVAALPGTVLRLDGTRATPEGVTAALADASFVHIASHAVSDLRDPSGSHLVLADGATLTVAQLAGHGRASGQLAYLSACSTAQSGVALVDESVHIASAFQLAGYRHVLAALWPLGDDFACRLAEEAYRRGVVRDPAHALHEAVRVLRAEDPGALVSWVSPVHNGP
ncbi:CHAT domain-containing protein [Streptomyces boluensis]